jgi:hypothetical protein
MHREIERNLRPAGHADQVADDATRRADRPDAASEPEELPIPSDDDQPRQARPAPPRRGPARDIARSTALSGEQRDEASNRGAADEDRGNRRAPPPPRPDPPRQPTTAPSSAAPATDDAEPRGPLLQNPSTGTREF